jgi:hypothetical protein
MAKKNSEKPNLKTTETPPKKQSNPNSLKNLEKGKKFLPGETGNPNGRPPKDALPKKLINDFLADTFGGDLEGLPSKEELYQTMIAVLLSSPNRLAAIKKNLKVYPQYVGLMVKKATGPHGYYFLQTALDRNYGLPTNKSVLAGDAENPLPQLQINYNVINSGLLPGLDHLDPNNKEV